MPDRRGINHVFTFFASPGPVTCFRGVQALLPGRVALYRDDIYVGRGDMPGAAKEETVRLGFGADDKVKVVRTVVRRSEGSAGIISSAKTDEREFKIAVRNGVYDNLPLDVVTGRKKIVDVNRYYSVDRLRPIYDFHRQPIFIMTSDE